LTKRTPEVLDKSRAISLNSNVLSNWADFVENLTKEKGFLPSHVYNADETGFDMNQLPNSVYGIKGRKTVNIIGGQRVLLLQYLRMVLHSLLHTFIKE
jgi:hypothetical protein